MAATGMHKQHSKVKGLESPYRKKKLCSLSYERSQHGPTVLSSESCDEWRMSGAIVGSTIEEVGKSLYQPITMLVKSNSSNKIRATPMKHLRSIRL